MFTVVEMGAAEFTTSYSSSIGFPDSVFDCNGICDGCSDDCEPSGNRLRHSNDFEQSTDLCHFYRMEKQTKSRSTSHGYLTYCIQSFIINQPAEIDHNLLYPFSSGGLTKVLQKFMLVVRAKTN